ncbi:hypothetical protein FH972_000529 [Carpinus fangiana]|uniref:Uncharacterized protein n=2 Tax=Carpinus fangiana TaxID=176857 RepID=A0A5N6QC07_9ROSI|nr:hypothetical protein FH972_000529 [Carpinus fangiana]
MEEVIVLYPSPFRGHLIAMVELGKLIVNHHPSFSVTILILDTASAAQYAASSATAQYIAAVNATTPTITFHRLPPVSDVVPSSSSPAESGHLLPRLNNPNLHQALQTISQTSKLKAFIIDFFCDAAFQLAANLSIPTYYFYTSSGSSLAAFLYLPTLHKSLDKSLKDLDDHMLVDIPGLPPLPASDMMKSMSDRSAKVYENFLNTATHMAKSNGLIVNTFDLLERKALGALRDGKCVPDGPTPPIFCIGPSISSSNIQDGENQHECLNWLNLQPSQSVVFLCFGSMGSFSAKQLQEIAVGLENSGQRAVLAKELKVALAVNESEDGLVSAAELEKRVRELMVSEAGKEVREKVSAMRDAAMAAVEEGGSAQVALAELAQSWVTTTC